MEVGEKAFTLVKGSARYIFYGLPGCSTHIIGDARSKSNLNHRIEILSSRTVYGIGLDDRVTKGSGSGFFDLLV